MLRLAVSNADFESVAAHIQPFAALYFGETFQRFKTFGFVLLYFIKDLDGAVILYHFFKRCYGFSSFKILITLVVVGVFPAGYSGVSFCIGFE